MEGNSILKYFFAKAETKLITLLSELLRDLWWPTVENCNFSFVLIKYLLKYFIPIRATCIRSCFQPSY